MGDHLYPEGQEFIMGSIRSTVIAPTIDEREVNLDGYIIFPSKQKQISLPERHLRGSISSLAEIMTLVFQKLGHFSSKQEKDKETKSLISRLLLAIFTVP